MATGHASLFDAIFVFFYFTDDQVWRSILIVCLFVNRVYSFF